MKVLLNTLLVAGVSCLSIQSFAEVSNIPFSPYADLTINTKWDPQYNDMEPMDLVKISRDSGVSQYHLAFITDSGNCQPAWAGQSDYSVDKSWGKHLTDKMQAANMQYQIAFGGASGIDLSKNCNITDLISRYEEIINTYQPTGLDFDIENGPETINVANIMRALPAIQSKYPALTISFTLPVMPEGLTPQGQDIVKQAKAAGLTYSVNIMAMDYGPAYPNDMGEYAKQAAIHLFTFLKTLYPEKPDAAIWKMVEVTPMIGVNDVNVEKLTLANVDNLREFAKQNQFGKLAMWSVARDNPCADKWASPVCSGADAQSKPLQEKPNEFAQRFLGLVIKQ